MTVKNGSSVTNFASSNTNVAVVGKTGLVKAKKAGTVTITVKNNGKTAKVKITVLKKTNTMTVKVKRIIAKSSRTTSFAKSKVFMIRRAQGAIAFKRVSGDKKISISKSGIITVKKGLNKGKIYSFKVKVTAAGNKNYKSSSKNMTVKIKVK